MGGVVLAVAVRQEGVMACGMRSSVLFCIVYKRFFYFFFFFFFKQKTAYEILTCDWSSDVCSSDLQRKPGSIKSGALPQREMVSKKSRGAAATRTGAV